MTELRIEWEPTPPQARVIRERRRFNVADCGRRLGKTDMGKVLAGTEALSVGRPVGWFAPTYKLLIPVWRELEISLAPVIKDKSKTEKRIELINGGIIEMWSLDSTDAGRSRRYSRVIVDEAAMVRG